MMTPEQIKIIEIISERVTRAKQILSQFEIELKRGDDIRKSNTMGYYRINNHLLEQELAKLRTLL
jgi:hypothetical protein